MYPQHFGFSRPLFQDAIPMDEAVFRTAAMDQIATDLAAALTRKDSVAILSGASGTGKTTLASEALKEISTQLAFTCISLSPLTADELLEQLLNDFGFDPHKKSRVERLQLWRQFLSEMAATSTRVCLLIENAEHIDLEILRSLHDLTVADVATSPGANVILTTQLSPGALISNGDIPSFNQRVRLRCRVEPLSLAETADYLEFKCRYGEVKLEQIFAADVADCLHAYSNGILRVIDNLLESTLIFAAAKGIAKISAESMVRIAEEQIGLARPEPIPNTTRDAEESSFPDAEAIPTLTDLVVIEDSANESQSLELLADQLLREAVSR